MVIKMRLATVVLIGLVITGPAPALACSAPELAEKMKAFAASTAAAFAKDPNGDEARKARVQAIIERYRPSKLGSNGAAIIDAVCREYDELIAIYQ